MPSPRAERSIVARAVPALGLLAVAGACLFFVASTAPAPDPTGLAAGQAASLAAPAWITMALALVAAALLALADPASTTHRAGGILGMSAAVGAALGGLLNAIGYSNSNIWWAAEPAGIRTSATVLLVVAVVALALVAAEQLRPGWRPRQDSNLRPRD